MARAAVSYRLPAYAALPWGQQTGHFILFPDRGDLPLRVHRPTLDHLFAYQLAALGTDDALLEWQNGTACSRRHLRPDGYGRYRRHGSVYGFFLEDDRATMSRSGYAHKFHAYYAYWKAQQYYRNQYSFPTVLLVTVSDAAEERIARVARDLARWQHASLPLLLTCQWRIEEEYNRPGLLGPIWRLPDADVENRRYWLPVTPP